MHPSTNSRPSGILRLMLSVSLIALLTGCAQLGKPPVSATTPAPKAPVIARNARDHEQQLAEFASAGHTIPQESVGYFMDVHQARLLQLVSSETEISVGRDNNRLRVILPGAMTFEQGSSRIAPSMARWLASLAEILAEFDRTAIVINGHTDSRGEAAFNQRLSDQRALAVAHALQQQSVDSRRLAAIGHGENKPIADNNAEDGRAANRRIEIDITPVITEPAK